MPMRPDGKYQPLWKDGDAVRVVVTDNEITYLPVVPEDMQSTKPVTRVPIGTLLVFRGVKWIPGYGEEMIPLLLFDYTPPNSAQPVRIMIGHGVAESVCKRQFMRMR